MISDVDKIKSKLSIVDVVSQYVELKPAGTRLKGLSPFTAEKTPSFFVSPEQGFYHCFSTDQGGDMFTFIQTIEGLDFAGALKLLADKAGVELSGAGSQGGFDKKKELYEALEAATQFFENCYREASKAQHFSAKRGITKKSENHFRIGYAPDNWRDLYDKLGKKFSDEVLHQAGLIKSAKGSTYDLFRDRLMFPIRDIAGRVVGFSGRRLDGDKVAKYINSPESPVFKKGEVLYGLYEGRNKVRELDFIILVEGQIDLVLAHQNGSANTVASSGTAFTPKHLEIINRYTDNVLLAFDSDSAGLKASVKVAEQAYRKDMIVKSIVLPDQKDPADVILDSPEEWSTLIKGAITMPQLLCERAKKTARNETNFISLLRKVILPLINSISSPILLSKALEEVAEISEVELSVLKEELTKIKKNVPHYSKEEVKATKTSEKPVNKEIETKDELLRDIAIKLSWLKHHDPKYKLPTLPEKVVLPEISSAEVLSNDYKDKTTAINSLNVSIRDLNLYIQTEKMDEKIKLLQGKSNKSVADLNELNMLIKQREDLLVSLE